jgi:hypothetical protein
MGTRRLAGWLWPLALLGTVQALAAEGHHAVDNALLLEEGRCEVEAWGTRARGGERLLHAGANCRVGPVEVGVASEYVRLDGESGTDWSVEAKWAMEVTEGFSIGAKIGPGWAAHVRPRYQGVAVAALATWEAREEIAVHLNLGRDFAHAARDQARYGAAVEWTPVRPWSLVAERYKEQDTHYARAGVRFFGGDDWSIDLSRAHRLAGPGVSQWTIGASFSFGVK